MKRTLIGIVTFGNLPFTQLTIRSIRETTTKPFDFFVIVGKPGDTETVRWLSHMGIPFAVHPENRGFPASLNDIYDYAFGATEGEGHGAMAWCREHPPREGQRNRGYDNLIIAGNDVVPYPGAVDALIECAETTDYEWIASSQLDVESLCKFHPELVGYFGAETFEEAKAKHFPFEQWFKRPLDGWKEKPELSHTVFEYLPHVKPWEAHTDFRPPSIEAGCMRDCHNLCLFKRSVAEKIGYIDVNFFPAYFSDNDYNRRATLAGVNGCTLPHSAYFHFWSRTIHQGSGGSTPQNFGANQSYYIAKWGGPVGQEKWTVPFNGDTWFIPSWGELGHGPPAEQVTMEPSWNIRTRVAERACIEYWKGLAVK